MNNLDILFKNIADAIREKKGTTEGIPAESFPTEIQTIGGVKVFETIEEMNNSTGNEKGDLALVYKNSTANMTKTTEIQTMTFPATVVLPTAQTASYSAYLQDETGMRTIQFNLAKTYFRVRDYMTYEYIAQYTSTDGITYTRTSTADTYTLETVSKFYGTWRDNFGYFVQVGSFEFGGLFSYSLSATKYRVKAYKLASMQLDTTVPALSCSDFIIVNGAIEAAWQKAHDELNKIPGMALDSGVNCLLIFENTSELTVLASTGNRPEVMLLDTGNTIIGDSTSVHKAVVNLDTLALTITEVTPTRTETFGSSLGTADGVYEQFNDCYVMCYGENRTFSDFYEVNTAAESYTTYDGDAILLPYDAPQFLVAPSQLTVSTPSTLLPNKIGFGSEGVVTGDDTFYNNTFDKEKILQNVLDVDNINDLAVFHTFPRLVTGEKPYNVLKYIPTTRKDFLNAIVKDPTLVKSASVTGGYYDTGGVSLFYGGARNVGHVQYQAVSFRARTDYSTYTGEITVGVQGDTIATYYSSTDNADIEGTLIMHNGVMYRLYYNGTTWYCYKLNGTSRTQVWSLTGGSSGVGDRILWFRGKYVYFGYSANISSADTKTLNRVDITTGTKTTAGSYHASYSTSSDVVYSELQNETVMHLGKTDWNNTANSIHCFITLKDDGTAVIKEFTNATIQNAGGQLSYSSPMYVFYGEDGKRYIFQRAYFVGHYWEWTSSDTFVYMGEMINFGSHRGDTMVQYVNGGHLYDGSSQEFYAYKYQTDEKYHAFNALNYYDFTLFSDTTCAVVSLIYDATNSKLNASIYQGTPEYITKTNLSDATKGYLFIAGDETETEKYNQYTALKNILLANEVVTYEDTISPAEYDEINAIAEDILGGVE